MVREQLSIYTNRFKAVITEDRGGFFVYYYEGRYFLLKETKPAMTVYMSKTSEDTIITGPRDFNRVHELYLRCLLMKYEYDDLRQKRTKTARVRRMDQYHIGNTNYEWSPRRDLV
jgi:hypothetical protein